MRKAVSEILIVIIFLMIAVALAWQAYTFISGFQEQAKTETQKTGEELLKALGSCLEIISFDDKANNLWVKNCGRQPISNITVFVDNNPVSSVTLNANPNEIKSITVSTTLGIHEIKLVSEYVSSATMRVSVINIPVEMNHTKNNIDSPVFFTATQGFDDYEWDFGDGTTGNGQNVKHIYTKCKWDNVSSKYLNAYSAKVKANLTIYGKTFEVEIPVEIWIAGDATGDGKVTSIDLGKIGLSWNTKYGDAKYDDGADLNNDDIINQADMDLVDANWNKKAANVCTL